MKEIFYNKDKIPLKM